MLSLLRVGARRVPASSCARSSLAAPHLPDVHWARVAVEACNDRRRFPVQHSSGRVRCFCSATDTEPEVLGTLGGRDIVSAGSVNEADYYVKTITKDDIDATFSRSQGAGGQNVNKVSTKADIRFDVKHSPWMSQKLKAAVMDREAGRMNKQGELLISSQVTRSQANNLTDAIARLQQLLEEAAESIKPIESDPKKVKALAKRKAKADRKRIEKKRLHSDKKKTRGKVGKGDW